MADKVTRAELAEAVRGLRAEVEALRAERAAHQCHGCCCPSVVYCPLPPQPQPYAIPHQVTCETPFGVITTNVPAVGTSTGVGTWTLA
jgi:hypothetical protein